MIKNKAAKYLKTGRSPVSSLLAHELSLKQGRTLGGCDTPPPPIFGRKLQKVSPKFI